MSVLFFIACSPIILLIVSLTILRLPAHKACLSAFITAAVAALFFFGQSPKLIVEASLDGIALACWPILLVITAAIFTYNLAVHNGAMKTIRSMLTSVSSDRRVLVLLIGWGFGAFMEGMAGFGTAVAIPAGMLAGIGIPPIMAISVCLIANSVPSAYGSIGVPLMTLAGVTDMDAILLARFALIQMMPLVILCPFLMTITAGRSIKALKGMIFPCFAAGLGFLIPGYIVAGFLGPGITAVTGSVFAMASIIACVKAFPVKDSRYELNLNSGDSQEILTTKSCIHACVPFILIFVFLLFTSKLVPSVHDSLAVFKSTVLIYSGKGGIPYTFNWINTPGVFIFLAAFIGGRAQGADLSEMLNLLNKTLVDLRYTMLTIISVIAAAKIMDYSGMTMEMARTAVAATGTMYPLVSAFIGSIGTFITGSITSSCVLFGKLQLGSAQAIGAGGTLQAWITASNASGACVGKIISPQSIAIGTAAIGAGGLEDKLLRFGVKVYIPYILILGFTIYFGQSLLMR